MGDKDIFREYPIRYLGYANEVGEAFRGVIPTGAVTLSYGIATTYVLAHTVDRMLHIKKKEGNLRTVVYTGFDTFLWQMLASVIIPGYTINRCCYGMNAALKYAKISTPRSKVIVTAFGLMLIPFIIEPVDKSVDYIMDKVVRPSSKKFIRDTGT